MKLDSLSVFFPAYNEAANIRKTVTRAVEVLPKTAKKWEVIVVDDGSTDKTGQIVKSLAKKEKRIRLVTHQPNRGYGEALKSGFEAASYDWIAMTDADGQFDFSQIDKLIAKTDRFQVVVGFRLNRRDPWHRRFFGWGWTVLAGLFLGLKVSDVDCGFKLVKKEVIEKIPTLESTRGGMISPELLAKAKKAGFSIAEVGVDHYPRQEGEQTGAGFKVIFSSFWDLAKLWWQLK